MKRGTIRHPKLLHLAALLELRPYEALGLLEALLDWTFDYARRGDVGRFDDIAIARGVGWERESGRLVAALIAARWLDPCTVHRLVVHGLAEHASRTWRQALKRARPPQAFVVAQPPASDASRETQVCHQVLTLSPPASASASASASATLDLSLATLARVPAPGFDEFWQRYPRHEGKQAARKAWAKLGPSPPLGAIVDALAWQRQLSDWQEDRGRYVPQPATYLNGRRWEDERPAPGALERLNAELGDT